MQRIQKNQDTIAILFSMFSFLLIASACVWSPPFFEGPRIICFRTGTNMNELQAKPGHGAPLPVACLSMVITHIKMLLASVDLILLHFKDILIEIVTKTEQASVLHNKYLCLGLQFGWCGGCR